jgi:hypothetical protein
MSLKPCRCPDCTNLIDSKKLAFYCSTLCRVRHHRLIAAQNKPAPTPISKQCRCCGKWFCTFKSRQIFCRESCKVNLHNQQRLLALKEGVVYGKAK